MICEYFHRLIILQIFVCGGEVDSKILANGEVYDPQVFKDKQLYIRSLLGLMMLYMILRDTVKNVLADFAR